MEKYQKREMNSYLMLYISWIFNLFFPDSWQKLHPGVHPNPRYHRGITTMSIIKQRNTVQSRQIRGASHPKCLGWHLVPQAHCGRVWYNSHQHAIFLIFAHHMCYPMLSTFSSEISKWTTGKGKYSYHTYEVQKEKNSLLWFQGKVSQGSLGSGWK